MFDIYHSLGLFSRRQTDDMLFFKLFFSREYALTFHRGDNLHEISNLFSGEEIKMLSAEIFTPTAKREHAAAKMYFYYGAPSYPNI